MPQYFGRFCFQGRTFYGKVEGQWVYPLSAAPFDGGQPIDEPVQIRRVRFLPPVCPTKIIAVGLNYADHARETGQPIPPEPLIWLKAPSSLIGHGGTVVVAHPEHRTDYEVELVIVIGRRAKRISVQSAQRYIFGYTIGLDITDRTIQSAESQWARAKSFDTYSPLGPYIACGIDPTNLGIRLYQNGVLKQNSNTSQLIFSCAELVSFLSHCMTLLPGDIIFTGTPSGVGPIKPGDRLLAEIDGIGVLALNVR